MGIHASDNLSHLAHQSAVPYEPGMYDYDDYVIREYIGDPSDNNWVQVGRPFDSWHDAREEFLRLFCTERRSVKLVGRVFN